MLCPLCQSQAFNSLKHKQVSVPIFQCQDCDLIFKSPASHLNWETQKKRYDEHNNTIENPGYVQFFEQLLKPLRPFLNSGMQALDWGSGPGEAPVLAQLLRREVARVDLYDPIYQPRVAGESYDLITCTEVIEHFLNPLDSFREILSHLEVGGVFAGLTQFHQGPEPFFNWWYVKDPTHVMFYSEKTFRWIAEAFDLEILVVENPVFIFRKK